MNFELQNTQDVIKKFELLEEERQKRIIYRGMDILKKEGTYSTKLTQILNNICPALPHLNKPANPGLMRDDMAEYNKRNSAYTYENSQGGFKYTEDNYEEMSSYLTNRYQSTEFQQWLDIQWDIFVDNHFCKMENSKKDRPCAVKGACNSCSSEQAKRLFHKFLITGVYSSLF